MLQNTYFIFPTYCELLFVMFPILVYDYVSTLAQLVCAATQIGTDPYGWSFA